VCICICICICAGGSACICAGGSACICAGGSACICAGGSACICAGGSVAVDARVCIDAAVGETVEQIVTTVGVQIDDGHLHRSFGGERARRGGRTRRLVYDELLADEIGAETLVGS